MTSTPTSLLTLLVCCGLVLAGVAVGVPNATTTTTASDAPPASVELKTDQQICIEPTTIRCLVAESYTLPDGGFVAVYDADGERLFVTGDPADEDVIGYIEPGSYGETVLAGGGLANIISESQTLTAVVFRDSDGNELPDVPQNTTDLFAGTDQPYTTNGEPVTDEASFVVGDVPLVDVGPDRTVESGDRVTLEAHVIDDAPSIGTTNWTQTAGPSVSPTMVNDFDAEFTAPAVSSPTTLTFRAVHTDRETNTGSDTLNVTVEPDSGPSASVDLRGGGALADGTQVELRSVTLSEGGFVTIRDDRQGDTGTPESVIGVTEYLSAGTHENVVVTLYDVPGASSDRDRLPVGSATLTAVAHRDTDEDQQFDFVASDGSVDGPYTDGGETVADDGRINARAFYQLDLIGGGPFQRLGPHADNGFYASSEENRLLRYAHGEVGEGLVSQGTAFPNATLRQCVESDPITINETTGTASVTLTVAQDCADQTLTLAIYEIPREQFFPDLNQTLFASTTETLGPGTHTLTVELREPEDV
jgi:hypothetical protein